MATTFELRTFKDIIDAAMEELKYQKGEDTDLDLDGNVNGGDDVSRQRLKRDINLVYLNEVVPYEKWKWLADFVDLSHPAALTGTATVTTNDRDVTLSVAPASSVVGHWFSTDGSATLYRIAGHTAGSTAIALDAPFTGDTSTTPAYKVWSNSLPLPTDLRDTTDIFQDFTASPLEGIGMQEMRRFTSASPKVEGRPLRYSTSDYVDPLPYDLITSLPSLSTRASSGLIKTLVFASTVAALVAVGDEIEVTFSGSETYNIKAIISSVSTTTITYTGLLPLTESAVADTSLVMKKKTIETALESYRELWLQPSIFNEKVTLHINYTKLARPMVNDADEPLMFIGDRSVLLYGALQRAWSRERNPEEATKNFGLYERKLQKMAGKLDDSTDQVRFIPSKTYMALRRRQQGRRTSLQPFSSDFSGGGGGGSSVSTPTGTANRAAVFDGSGLLAADSVISITELQFLNGITSGVVALTDTQTITNKTINSDNNVITNIVNADIKAAAAIAVNKLAALSNNLLVETDSSGFLVSSDITSDELDYLNDIEELTTFAMNDNQSSAANVATYAHASFTNIALSYSISRGSGIREGGMINIVTDGTTAGIAVTNASIGAVGVTFTADISGADLRLRYTSTSTGTAPSMKYTLQKWLA